MKGINIKPTFLETNIDLSKFIFLFNVIVEFEKNVTIEIKSSYIFLSILLDVNVLELYLK